jgi:glutaconate CoA-transferase subunit A
MAERASKVCSPQEAASLVKDGDTIALGGVVSTNRPMAVLRQLMKERRQNLSLIAFQGGLEIDLMIGLGMVKRLMVPYMGAEALAPVTPFYARWACEGKLEIEEVDLGTVLFMLRARAQRLPFLPSRGPVGTSLLELNPSLKLVEDPFGGPPVVAIPPAHVDVAILQANQADRYGNVQHIGASYGDSIMAHAADRVIVQVEKLVSNEEIRKSPRDTTIYYGLVDAVVVAPYGAHPFACQNYYRLDEAHLREYVQSARAYLEGQPEWFQAYVARYIDGPASPAEYLEAVGLERILSLAMEQ